MCGSTTAGCPKGVNSDVIATALGLSTMHWLLSIALTAGSVALTQQLCEHSRSGNNTSATSIMEVDHDDLGGGCSAVHTLGGISACMKCGQAVDAFSLDPPLRCIGAKQRLNAGLGLQL